LVGCAADGVRKGRVSRAEGRVSRVEGGEKSVEGRVAGFVIDLASTASLLTAMRRKISELAERVFLAPL
jgi:hypothetical protein